MTFPSTASQVRAMLRIVSALAMRSLPHVVYQHMSILHQCMRRCQSWATHYSAWELRRFVDSRGAWQSICFHLVSAAYESHNRFLVTQQWQFLAHMQAKGSTADHL